MSDKTFHIRIKKEYATALIEDLIKVHAVEVVEEDDTNGLTLLQKTALDKERASIAANPAYLQNWENIQQRFKKP